MQPFNSIAKLYSLINKYEIIKKEQTLNYIQSPLNGITLGLAIADYNNQTKTISILPFY